MNEQQARAVQELMSRDEIKKKMESENELIHSTFFNNTTLLKALRAVLTHLDATAEQKELVRSTFAGNDLLRKVVCSRFFHEYTADEPIGVNQNFWTGIESQLIGMPVDAIKQVLAYKKRLLEKYRAIDLLLIDPDTEVDNETEEQLLEDTTGAAIIARTVYTNSIENTLNMFVSIADSFERSKNADNAKDHSK
jgi:hypothetical protein